jgi:hypothetical protein
MVNRILVGGFAAAVAGAAMLAISSAPASALTLASPSLEKPVAGANVDKVWCNRWRCGGWGYRGGWGYGYGYHRHCGWNRWGRWVCWW